MNIAPSIVHAWPHHTRQPEPTCAQTWGALNFEETIRNPMALESRFACCTVHQRRATSVHMSSMGWDNAGAADGLPNSTSDPRDQKWVNTRYLMFLSHSKAKRASVHVAGTPVLPPFCKLFKLEPCQVRLKLTTGKWISVIRICSEMQNWCRGDRSSSHSSHRLAQKWVTGIKSLKCPHAENQWCGSVPRWLHEHLHPHANRLWFQKMCCFQLCFWYFLPSWSQQQNKQNTIVPTRKADVRPPAQNRTQKNWNSKVHACSVSLLVCVSFSA